MAPVDMSNAGGLLVAKDLQAEIPRPTTLSRFLRTYECKGSNSKHVHLRKAGALC